MEHRFWGQHLILDLAGCPKEKITDPDNITAWGRALVKAIDMVAYGQPLIENFAHDNPTTGGYTYVQLIETSCISAHFAENLGEAYIDVFSCKEFSSQQAIDVTKEYFGAGQVVIRDIYRGVKSHEKNSQHS